MAANDDGVHRFEVLVSGQYQRFEFDSDGDKFLGHEAELVERQTGGTVFEWIRRCRRGLTGDAAETTAVDLMVMVFIAADRAQTAQFGASELVWDHFIRTVAPFTFRPVDATPVEVEPAPSKPRAAPRKRAAAS